MSKRTKGIKKQLMVFIQQRMVSFDKNMPMVEFKAAKVMRNLIDTCAQFPSEEDSKEIYDAFIMLYDGNPEFDIQGMLSES